MKYLPYLFLLALVPTYASAQYSETIVSGRPGQSLGALTVGKDVYQVETGLNINWVGKGNEKVRNLAEITDIRIGLSERLELSALIQGSGVESIVATGTRYDRGISDTQLGGRFNFLQNDGWRPDLALQGRVLLRVQDEAFRRDALGSDFILAAEWGLTDLLGLTLNLNQTWPGDQTQQTAYAVTFNFSLTDRLSSFAEVYGGLSDGPTVDYDGGVAYLIDDHVQLDASVGWDSTDEQQSYYLDFGISFRLDGRVLRQRTTPQLPGSGE